MREAAVRRLAARTAVTGREVQHHVGRPPGDAADRGTTADGAL